MKRPDKRCCFLKNIEVAAERKQNYLFQILMPWMNNGWGTMHWLERSDRTIPYMNYTDFTEGGGNPPQRVFSKSLIQKVYITHAFACSLWTLFNVSAGFFSSFLKKKKLLFEYFFMTKGSKPTWSEKQVRTGRKTKAVVGDFRGGFSYSVMCDDLRVRTSTATSIHPSCYHPSWWHLPWTRFGKSIVIVGNSSGNQLAIHFPVELWRRSTPLGSNEIASPWIINYCWEFSAPVWKCQPSS